MTRLQNRTLFQLEHDSSVYRHRRTALGPYVWRHPGQAWAALSEVFPWEAIALSLMVALGLWLFYGSELAAALGFCLVLALSVFQLLRTKSFVTSTAVVQQRGLFSLSRRTTMLSSVTRGRVITLEGSPGVGDVVLETISGEVRLRSVTDPDKVLERLIGLRNALKENRAQ